MRVPGGAENCARCGHPNVLHMAEVDKKCEVTLCVYNHCGCTRRTLLPKE